MRTCSYQTTDNLAAVLELLVIFMAVSFNSIFMFLLTETTLFASRRCSGRW